MAAAPSNSAADAAKVAAYIGSLISLTTKSDMRYEGFMYHLNTQESTISLRDVRSFGTEGRRVEGNNVAPSERIYEYICFRGSDIKNLQVISIPPVQSSQTVPDDPAIIQSLNSLPPANISLAYPSALGGSSNTNLGVQVPPFQGNISSIQPVEVSRSWASLVPAAQAVQSYWPGFAGLPGGNSHFQQQPLPPLPPALLLANPVQLQLPQYSNVNSSLAGNSLNFPEPPHTLNLHNFTTLNSIPTISPPSTAQYSHISVSSLLSNLSSAPQSNTASVSLQTEMVQSGLQMVSSSITTSSVVPLVTNQAQSLLGPAPFPMISNPSSSSVGISSTSRGKASVVPRANSGSFQHPVTRQLSPSGYRKDENSGANVILPSAPEFTPSVSENVDISATELPKLPAIKLRQDASSSHYGNRHRGVGQGDVIHGGIVYPHQTYRARGQGRGRGTVNYRGRPAGRGSGMLGTASYPRHMGRGQGRENVPKTFAPQNRRSGRTPEWGGSQAECNFSEDFDFEAMNEKFNKEEVWGLLSQKDQKDGPEDERKGDESEAAEGKEGMRKVEYKSGYCKDDFFDSIPCAALEGESSTEKTNPSETCGEIQRAQPSEGVQGPARGGGSRGSYRGRRFDRSTRSRGNATWSRVA